MNIPNITPDASRQMTSDDDVIMPEHQKAGHVNNVFTFFVFTYVTASVIASYSHRHYIMS